MMGKGERPVKRRVRRAGTNSLLELCFVAVLLSERFKIWQVALNFLNTTVNSVYTIMATILVLSPLHHDYHLSKFPSLRVP